jgi:AmpD protein
MIIVDGWGDEVTQCVSPNFNTRPNDQNISLLVIHNISLPPKQFGNHYIEQFFQNCLPVNDHPYFKTIENLEVSSHFLIKRTGEIVQFVSCDDRAWHAGLSTFGGVENCNDYSIGIELEGADDIAYTNEQYEKLSILTKAIQVAYPKITGSRITGHEHISPGRKTDPGPRFDWVMYRKSLAV